MPDPTSRTAFAQRIADVATDGAALVGAGLIVAGVAQIYVPAAYIAAGAFILTGAWLTARRRDA